MSTPVILPEVNTFIRGVSIFLPCAGVCDCGNQAYRERKYPNCCNYTSPRRGCLDLACGTARTLGQLPSEGCEDTVDHKRLCWGPHKQGQEGNLVREHHQRLLDLIRISQINTSCHQRDEGLQLG